VKSLVALDLRDDNQTGNRIFRSEMISNTLRFSLTSSVDNFSNARTVKMHLKWNAAETTDLIGLIVRRCKHIIAQTAIRSLGNINSVPTVG
jgi:hypothetical protein